MTGYFAASTDLRQRAGRERIGLLGFRRQRRTGVASGKRAFISLRNPSSGSTLAVILAIWANSALLVAAGWLAVPTVARSASGLGMAGANCRSKAA
jgi:hypothetical protein